MKTSRTFLLTAFTLMLCYAFTTVTNDGLNVTYGVSEGDPAQIELALSSDYTFTYQDFSNHDQKIQVQGTYKLKNNKIELTPEDSQVNFHNHWKIADDGAAAKSRKGLTFYTLRKK